MNDDSLINLSEFIGRLDVINNFDDLVKEVERIDLPSGTMSSADCKEVLVAVLTDISTNLKRGMK